MLLGALMGVVELSRTLGTITLLCNDVCKWWIISKPQRHR